MAFSNPTIQDVSIPSEVPPNNTFSVEVTVRQGGPDPWASDGSCTSRNLDIAAWETPVRLKVDGETVAERELCLASGNERQTSLSASLSPGQHTVTVEVLAVGGNAYDLKDRQERVSDDARYNVSTSDDARDPSKPTVTDRLTRLVERVASALGTSSKWASVLLALGVLFLFLLPG
jgi:hypothetical protein